MPEVLFVESGIDVCPVKATLLYYVVRDLREHSVLEVGASTEFAPIITRVVQVLRGVWNHVG